MFQRIPKSITTTELQRNPAFLETLSKSSEPRILIKDSKQIGILTSVKFYNNLIKQLEELEKEIEMKDLQEAIAEVEAAKKSKNGLKSLKPLQDVLDEIL